MAAEAGNMFVTFQTENMATKFSLGNITIMDQMRPSIWEWGSVGKLWE